MTGFLLWLLALLALAAVAAAVEERYRPAYLDGVPWWRRIQEYLGWGPPP